MQHSLHTFYSLRTRHKEMRPLGQDLAWRLVANLGSVVLTAGTWAQSCPTLCDPMACSLPDSSVHGVLQTRVLEWVAISSSRASSPPRNRMRASCIARQTLYR